MIQLRTIFLIFILSFFFNSCKKEEIFVKAKIIPSKIDNISSNSEIEGLIHVLDTNFKKFKLRSIQNYGGDDMDSLILQTAIKLKINKSFYKEDFDNNGYTDLLVIGGDEKCSSSTGKPCDFCSFVVMNYGNRFKIATINKTFFTNSFVPLITHINSKPILLVYNVETKFKKKFVQEVSTDTLQFKFDNFIEYNDDNKEFIIEKIEYATSGCYGTCPVFRIDINKDRQSNFNADTFNFSEIYSEKIEGRFKTSITEQKYNEIISLLNYLNFPDLDNNYDVRCTDLASCTIKITYNGGKVKTISDYGKFGTYGLKLLYHKLSDLRFNQKWIKQK
jgi:hypothetical protein